MSACLFVCADGGKVGVGSRKSAKIGEMVPVCVGTEVKKMYRKGKQMCECKHISMCKTHKIRRKICCRTDGDVARSRWADRRDGQSGWGIAWGRTEGACAMMGAVGAEWATLSDGRCRYRRAVWTEKGGAVGRCIKRGIVRCVGDRLMRAK